MSLGDVVDKLHNQHGFSDTSSSEETDLSSSRIRSKEINDLDTSGQQLRTMTQVLEGRGVSVNRQLHLGHDRASLVDGLSDDIHNSAEGLGTHGHHDGEASVQDGLSTNETLS